MSRLFAKLLLYVALLLCIAPHASALPAQAADIAAVRAHFPAVTAKEFNQLDRPLRNKLAGGEIPELIIVFKTGSLPGASAALANDKLSKEERRALREQWRDQRSAQIINMQQQLMGDIGKQKSTIKFTQTYEHIPLALATASSWQDIQKLLRHPLVSALSSNTQFQPTLAESLPVINQPLAVSNSIDGTGTAIAIFDSGVKYTRTEFGSCTAPNTPASCKVAYVQDFAPDDGLLDDASNHGTGVSAMAIGVAPNSKLVVLDIFDGGSASSTDITAAANWVVANASTYNIVVGNFSLSEQGVEYAGTCDSFGPGPFNNNPFKNIFDSLVSADVLPVVASGNDGFFNGIGNPACVSSGFAIGATYDVALSFRSWSGCVDSGIQVDDITCFTNSGSELDMLAPGALITTGGWTNGGGTSFAAPHVAGAAALVMDQFPSSSLTALQNRLKASGTIITDSRNSLSFPRLDLAYSLDLIDTDGDGVLDLYDTAPTDPCVPSQFAAPCTTDTDSDGETDASEGELTDTDSDGTPDYQESSITDSDNDGVSDELDPANADPCIPSQFASPCTTDTDSDGETDAVETETADADSDGTPDYQESSITDTDSDGVSDELDPANADPCVPSQFASPCTTDTDGDGETDATETETADADSDGTPDYLESSTLDSDGDGVADELDVANSNPCVPSGFVLACPNDSDSDGETDASEGQLPDADSDGTPDYLESSITDTDSDGVSNELDPANADPCIPSQFAAPCTTDTDGDGETDATETETADADSDGTPDYQESSITDTDSDGVSNDLDPANADPCVPSQFAAPCTTDTDGDGKTDATEGEQTDTDGDGSPDYQESSLNDADNDGTVDELDPDNNEPCIPDLNPPACGANEGENIPLPGWLLLVLALSLGALGARAQNKSI